MHTEERDLVKFNPELPNYLDINEAGLGTDEWIKARAFTREPLQHSSVYFTPLEGGNIYEEARKLEHLRNKQ